MCLMVPGKISKIERDTVIVNYGSEKRKAKIIDKGYKKGDYVLVQGGIVVEKVPEQEAKEALKCLQGFV